MTDAYATIKLLASSRAGARSASSSTRSASTARAGRSGSSSSSSSTASSARTLDDGRGAAVPLELLGEIPTDFSVREAVQKRQLLLESMPGAPAALAVAAIAGRMVS